MLFAVARKTVPGWPVGVCGVCVGGVCVGLLGGVWVCPETIVVAAIVASVSLAIHVVGLCAIVVSTLDNYARSLTALW